MRLVTDGHLGGYVEGGDPATEYPDMWRAVVEHEDVQTVLDVGCGEGVAVDFFVGLGCRVLGIDGMPQRHRSIVQHDFTQGPFDFAKVGMLDPVADRFDLGWSCEFVEHVDEAHAVDFLAAFERCDVMLLTHALPGQPGWHHVNLREPDYWIALLASVGHIYDPALTARTRELAALNEHPANYYVASGMAFRHVQ